MNKDSGEAQRAKMAAEQAVLRMDAKLRHKLKPHIKQGLVDAILKSGAQDDLLFRNTPARFTPSLWSLTGLLSRLALIWNRRHNRGTIEDQRAALAETYSRVRQSGAVAMIIALSMVWFVGVIDFGEPAETSLQMVRDKIRPISASGDIVVVGKDERSAKMFGNIPWSRRHDAMLIDKLRIMGAKTIVHHQMLSDPTSPEDDAALAGAFDRANGSVWLGVQLEKNISSGKIEPLLPLALFRDKTQQAHFHLWFGIFGNVKNFPGKTKIGDRYYPSQPEILAGLPSSNSSLRPDYAINYKTIPTIAVVDIFSKKGKNSSIYGKTVIITELSDTISVKSLILGQGRAPIVYSLVITAETIKRGVARELGYLPALIAVAIIGIFCVVNRSRKQRAAIIGGAALALVIMMLAGDRVGWHFEMVPAFLLLIILGIREAVRGQLITAMTTNPVSGLPNLTELHYIKGRELCAIGAIKIEQYARLIEPMSLESQRVLINTVAARINIMCPDSVVHQGNDGLFVWLIQPDSRCDLIVLGGQINALFMVPVVGLDGMHDVGISIGIITDMDLKFGERLAVAIDRAKVPVYVTLREVL
jgi:diguanylate cyclase